MTSIEILPFVMTGIGKIRVDRCVYLFCHCPLKFSIQKVQVVLAQFMRTDVRKELIRGDAFVCELP